MKRIKSITLALTMTCFALPGLAKVTLDDVYKADAPKRAQDLADYAQYLAENSSPLVPRVGTSTPGKVTTFTVGGESNSVRTIALKSTTGWACALSKVSGYYGRGLKGNYARIYQSGGYWRLTSGRASCGGCSVSAEAICWEVN